MNETLFRVLRAIRTLLIGFAIVTICIYNTMPLSAQSLPNYEIIAFTREFARGEPAYTFRAFKIDRINGRVYQCSARKASTQKEFIADCLPWVWNRDLRNTQIATSFGHTDNIQPGEFWMVDRSTGATTFCWTRDRCIDVKDHWPP